MTWIARLSACLSLAMAAGLSVQSSPGAQERPLLDAEIAALLPTIIIYGDQTRQVFSAAGATTYTFKGRDSYGAWRVDGNRYCSQWPPNTNWDCYSVTHNAEKSQLIWTDAVGNKTVNRTEPKE